jgi:hypothetical protein
MVILSKVGSVGLRIPESRGGGQRGFGTVAVQNTREHGDALLREGMRQVLAVLSSSSFKVAVCDLKKAAFSAAN